ncbi:MAG TPA: 2-oxo acid dehydrogenase subunit E2 [Elusimicrobiota bacterium]|jgi:pyruvate dehydrogenase E2 component (dihydrolipoamide acetyltransferase)|nr:2-oxo acid dehydrogenase subunit E2 [Elusimicrobiota bacterium]
MAYEFQLPDVGEGLTEGEIVKWLVKEGDSVKENQPMVSVLTDKAEVEIASPKTGTIAKLMAKEGQKVPVHSVIVTINVAGDGKGAPAPAKPASSSTFEFQLPDVGEGLTEGEIVKWLVKEGDSVQENQPMVNVLTDKAEVEIPSPKTGTILKLLAKEGQKVPVHSVIVTIQTTDGSGSKAHTASHGPAHAPATAKASAPAPAKPGQVSATPAVRKLASDLGVDLARVAGTGPGGRITDEDVKKASGSKPAGAPAPAPAASHGPEERVAYKGIRRRTGEKMAQSKKIIPHVTHFDEADITALGALRDEMKGQAEAKGLKLTFMPFLIKALAKSLKEFPNLNSSLDDAREEIVLKKYVNVGIAVNTPQGLFVPVLKDADKKDLLQLAADVGGIAQRARDNKLAVPELQGGTITVTNIGPIGGLFATPIINHPEVAILGVMKAQERPVVREGKVVVRTMLNLALAFDHRVVDGAEAASFMNTLVKHLENPRTLV